jgi:hypothetical protein
LIGQRAVEKTVAPLEEYKVDLALSKGGDGKKLPIRSQDFLNTILNQKSAQKGEDSTKTEKLPSNQEKEKKCKGETNKLSRRKKKKEKAAKEEFS